MTLITSDGQKLSTSLAALKQAGSGWDVDDPDEEETVTSQLASGSISAQALELASRNGHHIPGTPDTYRHGWKPINGGSGDSAAAAKRMRAAARAHGSISAQVAGQPKLDVPIQHVLTKVEAATAALEEHKAAAEKARSQAEHDEHVRRVKKLAVEAGVAVGGALLGIIENKLGLPDALSILSSVMGPALIQVLTEFFKRL